MASTRDGARNAKDDDGGSHRVRLRLLGAVELDGPVRLRFLPERRFRLLAYVALNGSWVARDQLANLFWPDRTQDAARNNLRKLLFEVRALGVPALEDSRHALRWPVEHDATELARAHAQGDHRSVLSVYRGTPLHGLDGGDSPAFATWMRGERLRLRSLWRESVLATVRDSPPQAAVELSQRLLDDDPFDEDAVRVQMRALAALGRAADVTRIYRSFAERVAEELGVDVAIETRNLARELQLDTPPTPVGSAGEPAAKASVGSEGFVGRGAELAELEGLLTDPQCRLITVTGPGGMGKSRLVKEVIHQRPTHSGETVCWIALDDLTDITEVAPRVARELKIELSALQDPIEIVATHLAPLSALLVFDNSEHLPSLSELIERWLKAAPQLKILATSRVRIGIKSEWLMSLRGLEVGSTDTRDGVLQSDAARLFAAHAQLAQPRFDPASNAKSVADLVRAVGGMPLAILLAASWIRLLPVTDMVSDLTHLLDVLEQADEGDERPEHRSMRATFKQSWRLLSPVEQEVLMVLSVFAGTFSRAAVHDVAQAPLPVLGSLIDKSLVQIDSDGRCSLHPLIRQFAAEKLSADAESEAGARTAHLRYFDQWVRRITDVPAAEQPTAIALMEVDFENIRLMWRHAVTTMACDTLAATAVPLMRFFTLKSRWIEGDQLLEEAADALPNHNSDDRAVQTARANIGRAMATVDFFAGRHARCIERAERSLRLCRELSIRKGIPANLNNLGLAHWQLGQLTEAAGYFEQAIEEARANGDTDAEAIFLGNSALVARAQGNYRVALRLTEAALAVDRARDNKANIQITLTNLGNLHRALQEPRQAIVVLTEALARATQRTKDSSKIYVLCNLALAHVDLGEYEQALRHAEASLALQLQYGEPALEASIEGAIAVALIGLRRFREAREHLVHALQRSLAERRLNVALGTLVYWGKLLAAQGDVAPAASIFRFAADHGEIHAPERDLARRELASVEQHLGPERTEQARHYATVLTLESLAAQLLSEADPMPRSA